MSKAFFRLVEAMKNPLFRVTLEPELEEIAASWPAAKRFEAARKFSRWARQLKVSASIMASDARGRTFRRISVPRLPRRKTVLN